MARIKTQTDFIKKATEIHDGKYDYSQVVYVKSSENVKIICPIHGEFEQTPNKHLQGRGCPKCGREQTKLGLDEFIRRARLVHGDRYDYSKVQYERRDKKVVIICPEHGEFLQTPHCHVVLGQNCPKCSAIAGGIKRMGDNNPMRQESAKQKARETCIERYGTKTYAESDEGRKKLHDIIVSDDVQQRTIQTCMDRYGAKNWTQSEEGRERLHEIMSSDEMQEKVRQGYVNVYGVDHYMKTYEGRIKARQNMMLPERKAAIQRAFMDKYGVPNAWLLPTVHAKGWQTKRRNGTFNTSKPEETLYLLLCDVFGKDDVFRQYVDPIRYPFHCDFYIKSLDAFIELNALWTHGPHWFDESNPFDVEILSNWESHRSSYYDSAAYIWTIRDPMKRQCAIDNNLNYLVFWDNDLTDAREWLSQYM